MSAVERYKATDVRDATHVLIWDVLTDSIDIDNEETNSDWNTTLTPKPSKQLNVRALLTSLWHHFW